MRSPENVLESLKSKACNKSYKYERLYRNLYNPQFYLLAYQRIQAKPGNMTAGTDGKTIDGMGMARINALIEKMRDFSYQPNPARRTYIPKSNGKMRPLGIPSFDDKLIQEVVRLILESIYEPTFSDYSHGFRINRSCHTALKYVQKYFTGTKWFVEGDIKGCFDNVDHHVLIAILRKRIADEHFIGLLWKFLKAGYMEDWNYHNTYSGTPQGSIISPILANIYMNELDSYMAEYAEKFNCGNRRKINPAFKKKLDVCRGKEQRLKRNLSKMSEEEKEGLIAEIRELRRSLKSMPYSDQMDDSYKRICYIRYADDFLIGVIGSKEDAEQIKQDVGCFIRDKLHLEMSEEKTLITHGHDAAKFLGYEVTIAKGEHNKKTKTGATRRVNNGKVLLYVPHDKWVKRLFSYNALKIKYDKQNGNKEVWEPVRRTRLLHLDDLEILNQYNAEIRGLYNYYRLANNVSVLNNFYYVMRYSMLKTFAGKYRTRISRIIRKYRQGKDFVVEYPKKNGKVGKVLFYNNGFRRDTKVESGNPDIKAYDFTFPLSMVSRVLIALMLLTAQSSGIPSNCTVAISTARGLMSNPITFSPNFCPSHSTVPEPQNGSNTVDVVGSALMISFSIHACMGATITAGYLTRGASFLYSEKSQYFSSYALSFSASVISNPPHSPRKQSLRYPLSGNPAPHKSSRVSLW